MIHRSDPVILGKVAARTLAEARTAWRTARAAPTEANVRAAYYACILAGKCAHAAGLDADAVKIKRTAVDLGMQLATM